MNVTPGKILLAASLGALAYCNWDYLAGDKPSTASAAKAKDPAATAMNHTVTLALAGDPFNSKPVEGGFGTFAPTVAADGTIKAIPGIDLQGIFLSCGQRVALVNGRILHQGESIRIPDGPTIRAQRVAEDFVIIEGNGQVMTLRLDMPNIADKTPKETIAVRGAATPQRIAGANPEHR